MNSRRKLVIALGAGALVAPFGAFAQQQGKVWRLGYLGNWRPDSTDSHPSVAFLRTLRELGYVEGKNLVIEWRYADNNLDRFPGLAAELVQLKVDVILAAVPAAVKAAQKESTTIPIIMGTIGDPVGLGLIKSLARPGGNVTGPATLTGDLASKRFEMLHTMVPKLSRLAILVNPSNTTSEMDFERVQSEAQKRGLKVMRAEAQTPQEIDNAISTMVREKAGALLVLLNPLFQQQRSQIAELALKHRLPVSAGDPIYVEAGCLMSYGPSLADGFRRAAIYVDKIFKGAKPADLPVEQPTKFELVINRNTAKALGLTIPQSLLISADKVIE